MANTTGRAGTTRTRSATRDEEKSRRLTFMLSTCWQQHLSQIRQRLLLYPAPEPLPRTRSFWLATGLVMLAVLAFAIFFISYLTSLQDAYLTHAEDLGNMDQALWNTFHGQLLHQT